MTLINRVLCRMPETKADLLDSMTKWPDNQPGAWYYLAVQEATNSHTYEQKDSKYETWTALTAEPDWSKYKRKAIKKAVIPVKGMTAFSFFKLIFL